MAPPPDPTGLPRHLAASAYDYELPEALVAQEPACCREDARLLHLDRRSETVSDRTVPDLRLLLRSGDLLVLNDTRVVPGRLIGVRTRTGGRAEALVLERGPGGARVLLGTRGSPAPGEELSFGGGALRLTLVTPLGEGVWTAATDRSAGDFDRALDEIGQVPLPPYIRRDPAGDPRDALDRERYQTVFARKPGAAAAPTAGLHLTAGLLADLADLGVESCSVTLHIGPGTFRPVQVEDLREHPMHEEAFEVDRDAADAVARCRARRGRVVPVGTTSVRVLESACGEDGLLRPASGRTRLFIHEPFRFRFADALLTNFHAPRSTLLMLVSAMAGRERILAAYAHAVREGYRFLSYGDAMFIS